MPPGRQIEGRRFYLENLYPAALVARKRPAQIPKIPRRLVKPELGWSALDDPLPALSMVVVVAFEQTMSLQCATLRSRFDSS